MKYQSTLIAAATSLFAITGCAGRAIDDPGTSPTTAATASGTQGAMSVTGSSAGNPATLSPESLQVDLLQRWNTAADTTATSLSFHWPVFTQFPHPTYKGGTREAYGEFANVLLAFLQARDDFDFIVNNHLLDMPLRYVFPNGQDGLRDISFKELIVDFSSDNAFGDISASTRVGLKVHAVKVQSRSAPSRHA
jgi:hypothetical protein